MKSSLNQTRKNKSNINHDEEDGEGQSHTLRILRVEKNVFIIT